MARTVKNDLAPGMVFGEIILIDKIRIEGRRGTFWICRCSCGSLPIRYAGHIRAGQAKSCGCVKGANRTHMMSHSPEYKAWDNARSRCYREKDIKYPLYGGRGIKMCDTWRSSFEAFFSDMGQRPSPKHSLDRVNSNGDYEPGNCRWATIGQQNNNRSSNRHVLVNGKRLTVAQASVLTGVPHATILGRIDRGVPDEEAVANG